MFHSLDSSNRFGYIKGLAFLLLIFALATSAFSPISSGGPHATVGNILAGPLPAASLPAAFNKSSPANGVSGLPASLKLKWGASINATGYEYCIDTSNDNTCNASWNFVGTKTSIALSSLNPGTSYYWQVRATNATGTTFANGSDAAWWSFTVALPPGAFDKTGPANGAAGLPAKLTLSWNASSNATSYEYCIDTSNNNACNTSWISTGMKTSHTLTLTPGTRYYWQVRATNVINTIYADTGSPAWWSLKIASIPGAFGKTKPVLGATKSPFGLTLIWQASSNATEYQYCIDTVNDNTCNTSWISTGTDTSVGLDSLTPTTTYYWQVRAKSLAGSTYANSAAWWYFTTSQLPGAFHKSKPSNGATNQPDNVTLSWSDSNSATDYQYCIDTVNDNACNASWISTGGATSIAISSLKPATTYYWQVRAKYSGYKTYANGSAAAWWYFTVSSLPGSFSKTSPGNGTIDLSQTLDLTSDNPPQPGYFIGVTLAWTASKSANSYAYCIDSIDDNICNTSWISVGNNTSAAAINLQLGGHYYWQVRAKNASGLTYANGSKTAWWSFSISNTGQ